MRADDDGLCEWRERVTGRRVDNVSAHLRSADWATHVGWYIVADRVQRLSEHAKHRNVFVGGSVENEIDVWHLFDRHVCLVVDDAVVADRIQRRTNNDYGKGPGELQSILEWNKTSEENYRRFGAAVIDASRPLPLVVDDVLKATVTQCGLVLDNAPPTLA